MRFPLVREQSDAVPCLWLSEPHLSQLAVAKVPSRKAMLERQIAAVDRAIDERVYALYDLTPEEIRIVEEGAG